MTVDTEQTLERIKAEPPKTRGEHLTPNWDDLKIFNAVCTLGSFSKAAELLQITQPTISRRIDGLERFLGTQLLVRSPSGVTPTDDGRMVLEHSNAMQLTARELTRKVRQSDDAVEGTVRVAVPDGLLTYWLTPRLTEFQRAYPLLSLEFICGLYDMDLDLSGAHLTLQFSDQVPQHFVALPLGSAHHVPYASKEYLGLFGRPKTVKDLVDHRYIHHTNQKHQSDKWDREILALSELVQICFITNASSAVLEAVRRGIGIGMLPTYMTTDENDIEVLDFDFRAQAQFWLVYERRLRDIARFAVVIDWIKSVIDKHRMPWFADNFIHPSEYRKG